MKITGFHPANRLAKASIAEYISKTPCDNTLRIKLLTDARILGLALVEKNPTKISIMTTPGYSETRVSYE